MNKEVSNTVRQTFDDEINLRDIFIALWKEKYRILLFGIISLSVALVYLMGVPLIDKTRYASLQVHFNFEVLKLEIFQTVKNFHHNNSYLGRSYLKFITK
jgi:hypothetical protein